MGDGVVLDMGFNISSERCFSRKMCEYNSVFPGM
jgi:hypothetical protein